MRTPKSRRIESMSTFDFVSQFCFVSSNSFYFHEFYINLKHGQYNVQDYNNWIIINLPLAPPLDPPIIHIYMPNSQHMLILK